MRIKSSDTNKHVVPAGNVKMLAAGLFCLVLGAVGSFVTVQVNQNASIQATNDARTAAKNAQVQAQNIKDAFCGPGKNEEIELCVQAQQVIDNPNTKVEPIKGEKGEPGVGVVSSVVDSSGVLVVTYTDGTSDRLGKITGSDGKDGKDGTNGTNGKDGVSVTSQAINDVGHLIVAYSNGTFSDLGYVIGAQGIQGIPGVAGPAGPAGKDGAPGTVVQGITATCVSGTLKIEIKTSAGTVSTAPTDISCVAVIKPTASPTP